MKLIKVIVLLFFVLFTTHAWSKGSSYYQATIVHVLTQCNSECRHEVFEMEMNKAFFALISAILNEVKWKLTMKQKELYD